jgi:hypothetical protein
MKNHKLYRVFCENKMYHVLRENKLNPVFCGNEIDGFGMLGRASPRDLRHLEEQRLIKRVEPPTEYHTGSFCFEIDPHAMLVVESVPEEETYGLATIAYATEKLNCTAAQLTGLERLGLLRRIRNPGDRTVYYDEYDVDCLAELKERASEHVPEHDGDHQDHI